jgi:signal transduction histidine kinase
MAVPLRPRARLSRAKLLRTAQIVVAFFAVTGLAVLAITLTQIIGTIAAMWAAGGVAFAVWAGARRDRWTDICFIALFGMAFTLANVLVRNGELHVAVFAASDTLEVALAVFLVRRYSGLRQTLRSLNGVARFIAVCFGAPFISAIAVGVMMAAEGQGTFFDVFATWLLGHGLGFAVVAPFLITLRSVLPRLRSKEGLAFLGVTVIVIVLVIAAFSRGPTQAVYLVYPPLLLATLRFRLFGAATAGLIVAITHFYFSTSWIASGLIPPDQALESMRNFQLFVICVCLPALAVAAVLDERDFHARLAGRQRAKAELANSEKSRLMENVSHEMRTPLNALVSVGEILAGGQAGPLTPAQSALMGTMVGGARTLHRLADNLTSVAAAEIGDVSVAAARVDVALVASQVCAGLEATARGYDATIAIEAEARVEAFADPALLGQILESLVTNAIKFAGSAGPITIRALRPATGTVRIEVCDRGPGVAGVRHDAVFEPFNRLGKSTAHADGSGIGLALARKLAELQGGRLDYTSTPGEGSCFWVELPAAV